MKELQLERLAAMNLPGKICAALGWPEQDQRWFADYVHENRHDAFLRCVGRRNADWIMKLERQCKQNCYRQWLFVLVRGDDRQSIICSAKHWLPFFARTQLMDDDERRSLEKLLLKVYVFQAQCGVSKVSRNLIWTDRPSALKDASSVLGHPGRTVVILAGR